MSKSLDNLEKLASKFEEKLKKLAQPMQEPTVSEEYSFQQWLDTNFSKQDKNKIANEIVNAVPDDVNSLHISLMVANKKVNVVANVNGMSNPTAKSIVMKYLAPKMGKAPGFPDGSAYKGWITYNAK